MNQPVLLCTDGSELSHHALQAGLELLGTGRRYELVTVVVQINGRVRARVTVPADASEEQLRDLALADAAVKTHTSGKTIRRVVVARGPLVSVVVQ